MVLGEVLWDLFEHSRRLGGAPLNFGVHARRLGHPITLSSAVGADELGKKAAEMIASLGLDTRLLQATSRFPTGTARYKSGPKEQLGSRLRGRPRMMPWIYRLTT